MIQIGTDSSALYIQGEGTGRCNCIHGTAKLMPNIWWLEACPSIRVEVSQNQQFSRNLRI
jgi:hypothetical protein